MKLWLTKTWKENRSFIVFIMLMFVFRSAIADWNHVPTGSMKPTILEGDHVLVNKMAYDIRFPFTHISLIKRADPVRGDIIVFDSKVSDKRLIKRVVGIPGDIIAMQNNVLYINGERLSYLETDSEVSDKIEDLLGVEHKIRTLSPGGYLSSFNSVIVPADQYMALGDNRDNSADSRVIGFVPRNEIVGRSRKVVLSINYDNYYIPRSKRFFHTL
ncbi:MAG: signal peptidase I [Gammaproteobacteria bacterium]|jgi:signal peptidase I